jgi:hypothetical protein
MKDEGCKQDKIVHKNQKETDRIIIRRNGEIAAPILSSENFQKNGFYSLFQSILIIRGGTSLKGLLQNFQDAIIVLK